MGDATAGGGAKPEVQVIPPDPVANFVQDARNILKGTTAPDDTQQKDLIKSLLSLLAAAPAQQAEPGAPSQFGPAITEKIADNKTKPYWMDAMLTLTMVTLDVDGDALMTVARSIYIPFGMVLRVVLGCLRGVVYVRVVYMVMSLTILLDWARMTGCFPRIYETFASYINTILSPFFYSYLGYTHTLGPLPLRLLPTP